MANFFPDTAFFTLLGSKPALPDNSDEKEIPSAQELSTNQSTKIRKIFTSLQVLGRPPGGFLLDIYIAFGALLLFGEWTLIVVWQGQRFSFLLFLAMEILFHMSMFLLFQASTFSQPAKLLCCLIGVWLCNFTLNIIYLHTTATPMHLDWLRGYWESGNIGLWLCCIIAFYRLPIRWALPPALVTLFILAETSSSRFSLPGTNALANGSLIIVSGGALLCCVLSWIQRERAELFLELQQVQALLRWQIGQTEKLAADRERTRIARDIHDMLAHSFAILSIQLQAARQFIHQDQHQLALKLEEMTSQLDEGLTESRRIVNLLRGIEPQPRYLGTLSTRLRAMVTRFGELTDIQCIFEEQGMPSVLNDEHNQTLSYTLQEALTNAHLHGKAQTIWVELLWQDTRATLSVRNNRQHTQPVLPVEQPYTFSRNVPRGHYGLQGMQERASALGGDLEIKIDLRGEFTIVLTLPISDYQ